MKTKNPKPKTKTCPTCDGRGEISDQPDPLKKFSPDDRQLVELRCKDAGIPYPYGDVLWRIAAGLTIKQAVEVAVLEAKLNPKKAA